MPSVKETVRRWVDGKWVFPSGKEQWELVLTAREKKNGQPTESAKMAREQLWTICERICAKKIRRRVSPTGFEDALHWACLEVFLPAIENYDPKEKMKFVSYVVKGVELKLYRWLAEQRLIRIPEHTLLKAMEGGAKSPHLAAALRVMFVSSTDQALSEQDESESEGIKKEAGFALPPLQISLEEKFPTEQAALREILGKTIRQGIEILQPREREVIILTFGLNGNGRLTNPSTAKLLGISRSALVTIKRDALRKLGHYILEKFPQARLLKT